jgi:hypothetical protein
LGAGGHLLAKIDNLCLELGHFLPLPQDQLVQDLHLVLKLRQWLCFGALHTGDRRRGGWYIRSGRVGPAQDKLMPVDKDLHAGEHGEGHHGSGTAENQNRGPPPAPDAALLSFGGLPIDPGYVYQYLGLGRRIEKAPDLAQRRRFLTTGKASL